MVWLCFNDRWIFNAGGNFSKTGKFKKNMYEVRLPWIERVFEWMDSYELSSKSLYSLGVKF